MTQQRPIGVIGLGDTGRALAARLVAAGRHVVLYDPDGPTRRAASLAPPASQMAPSLTDFGHDCEIVLSALPDAAELRDAAFGEAERPGFALAMRAGSVIAHFGAGPYKEILRLTGQLGSGGIGLLDVLICAIPRADADCPLEMLVGGYADLVDRARYALDPLGNVTRIGATGTATGLAALRGYVRAARLIALSEAMLIGRHAGMSPELMARVFDGPVAAGPECRSLTGEVKELLREHDLGATCRAVTDAVAFSERIGVSGECVAFARDMLSDAMGGMEGGDESTLLRHFTNIAATEG